MMSLTLNVEERTVDKDLYVVCAKGNNLWLPYKKAPKEETTEELNELFSDERNTALNIMIMDRIKPSITNLGKSLKILILESEIRNLDSLFENKLKNLFSNPESFISLKLDTDS